MDSDTSPGRCPGAGMLRAVGASVVLSSSGETATKAIYEIASSHQTWPLRQNRNYYELLGVSRKAPQKEIRQPTKTRRASMHPDLNPR